jgi:hypothetical protein
VLSVLVDRDCLVSHRKYFGVYIRSAWSWLKSLSGFSLAGREFDLFYRCSALGTLSEDSNTFYWFGVISSLNLNLGGIAVYESHGVDTIGVG